MGREGNVHLMNHMNACSIYIYVLGSTAAELIRWNRNLKLCQAKLELFVSLSLLLLVSAGSACAQRGTCRGWDAEEAVPGVLPAGGTCLLQQNPLCADLLHTALSAGGASLVILTAVMMCPMAAGRWWWYLFLYSSLQVLPAHEQKCLKPCPDLQSKMID